MKKRLIPPLLAALLLSGCTQAPVREEALHILCTTYPVYLLTTDLIQGMEESEVQVELLVNAQTSCLHDYSLTVKDMKAIERADIIITSGTGLEDFMADALAASAAAVIDCSEGIDLLPAPEHADHDGHDHEEEYDPHYWMDPGCFLQAGNNLRQALTEFVTPAGPFAEYQLPAPTGLPGELSCPYLITFHDGFQYFAQAHGLTLLKAIEEEEGSTVSAQEIKEIVALIKEYDIPAIFVEKNGSRSTAEVIARETGCKIYELDMLMSGDGTGIRPYFDAMTANRAAVQEALQ